MKIAEIMKSCGLTIDNKQSDDSGTYATYNGLRFRALHYTEPEKSMYELHIAIDANFDRWSNSVDFIAPLPRSVEHMNEILAAVKVKIDSGEYNNGYGERFKLNVI